MQVQSVTIEVSPGELIDKITILEIKQAQFTEPERLRNVRKQLELLEWARRQSFPTDTAVEALTRKLKAVNERLWQTEIDLRQCEQQGLFGKRFVELARSVYRHNDRRAALKGQINEHLGSALVEEKSYDPGVGMDRET